MSATAIPKIYPALARVMEEIGPIEKSQQGHGYKFRGIDQLMNFLHPLLKKNNILITRRIIRTSRGAREVEKPLTNGNGTYTKHYSESTYEAEYVLISLEDGSSVASSGCGEGQDTSGGDKSMGMAQSNALKYMIFEMFSIPTEAIEDSDMHTARQSRGEADNASSGHKSGPMFKPPSEEEYTKLKKLMEEGKKKEALGLAAKYKLKPKQTKELNTIFLKQKAETATKEAESMAK